MTRSSTKWVPAAWLPVVLLAAGGCSPDVPRNPSFPLKVADARAALVEMIRDPKPLRRPVVVLGPWMDPGLAEAALVTLLKQVSGQDRVIGVSFLLNSKMNDCRASVISAVERRFPCNDFERTVPVDVVAFSMGGIIARHAAMVEDSPWMRGKRLNIVRLFTIGSPHRGAKMAFLVAGERQARAMEPNSRFLTRLNHSEARRDYTIFPYVRLGDTIVGTEYTAPPGQVPWWVANEPLEAAHLGAFTDRRILADILRRLRYEPPYTRDPATPLP